MQRVFSSPEFLRTVNTVPFDAELEGEAARRREYEASYVFARTEERRKSIATCRAIVGGIIFSALFAIGFYALCCATVRHLWFR